MASRPHWIDVLEQRLSHLAKEATTIQEAFELDPTNPAHEQACADLCRNIAETSELMKVDGLSEIQKPRTPRAALATISYCLDSGLSVPEWATATLAWFYEEQEKGHYRSWDQIFGKPTTPARAARRQRDFDSLGKISDMVVAAKANDIAIDNNLFDQIGRALGVGGRTRVSKLYSKFCRPAKANARKSR